MSNENILTVTVEIEQVGYYADNGDRCIQQPDNCDISYSEFTKDTTVKLNGTYSFVDLEILIKEMRKLHNVGKEYFKEEA